MNIYTGYFKRLGFLAFVATVAIWVGCADHTDVLGFDTRPSEVLAFTTSLRTEKPSSVTRSTVSRVEIVEEEWTLSATSGNRNVTRGVLSTYLDGNAGVMGFQYNAGATEVGKEAIAASENNNNVEFTFNGDELKSTSSTILWNKIEKDSLDIYAYAPKELNGLTVTSSTAPPELTYTVPDEIANQKDLLVAKWKSIDQKDKDNLPVDYKNQTIHLTFDHALTAICFKVGFACTVQSVKITGVHNSGTYSFLNDKWTFDTSTADYMVSFENAVFQKNDMLTAGDNTMILMPQTLPADAKIVLTCKEGEEVKVYTADIGGKEWKPGKLVTYTIHKDKAPTTIYFDLALANVVIDGKTNTYSGAVWKDGELKTESGTYNPGDHYYVYQSTEANRNSIWSGEGSETFTSPAYGEVIGPDGRPWREYITNNTDVNAVIDAWHNGSDKVATDARRSATKYWIDIKNNVTCDLTIDNIYSTYQNGSQEPNCRVTAGITFRPIENDATVKDAKVTINMVGDNRVGAVHYYNPGGNNNEIIFEGTGSLTVADVDGITKGLSDHANCGLDNTEGKGYWSNFWSSAIGGCDDNKHEESSGIVINSGIIFAGTTKAENCTAIGGGGNSYGKITINGGTVTAVATTTGTAIGGGIGYNSEGGKGEVYITGGNVYAYNHANKWKIPSSAIGGAGSKGNYGETGIVNISGGYVYAESALGTAIGGGSSYSKWGGNANVTITGGEVFAKTGSKVSAGIGGGTACTGTANAAYNGGSAIITIENNPIIRTGSIGGGGNGIGKGNIGNATINISGGDIQAQFLLSAGTDEGDIPIFTMTGGMIRNSNTADTEYLHVRPKGGAVYLENGQITISGGTIRNCTADEGGAIYIEGVSGGTSNASFTMTGGKIQKNESNSHGGAICIKDGTVTISGGTIDDNLAAGGNGGGIFIQRGSLTVDGSGGIQNNSAEIRRDDKNNIVGGNGGGIYVYSQLEDVDVNLVSGRIKQNTADRRGGGVCVDMANSDMEANVTIGGSTGDLQITGNHSLLEGGGLYARGSHAHITINSGTIKGNTVSQYVYNKDVANELGEVTLNGGDVEHKVVTFHANDGKDTAPRIQNIVTSTNSRLVVPDPPFHRTGYKLVGWNTKANGRGAEYTDGQIMNITEDIDLYAQWQVVQ